MGISFLEEVVPPVEVGADGYFVCPLGEVDPEGDCVGDMFCETWVTRVRLNSVV